jgi:hypothetical protein
LTGKAFPLFVIPPHDVTTVVGFPPDIARKAMFFSQGFCGCLVYLSQRYFGSGFGGFGQSV